MVVFAEVSADLDRRRELVRRSDFSDLRILAPSFLYWESDRRDTQSVWECGEVVTLVFVDRTESLTIPGFVGEI